ncbi:MULTISPECIES: phosphoethanolamine transferase [unclassified Moraxella]|uniref:phosphoethanolamine transferase n=1 Tax=unclassified Moraxella TaxID=2685852 RepID=UPI003AF8C46F
MLSHFSQKRPVNAYWLLPIVALFLVFTGNDGFFAQINKVYPIASHIGFTLSVAMVLFGVLLLLMWLFSYRFTLKFVLVFLLMVASITGYFTDTYGTVYDTTMLQNAMQTDKAESSDLFNILFLMRILLLGVLPSWAILRQKVYFPRFKHAILQRLGVFVASLALIGLPIVAQSKQFASFFREHKPIRFYTNPVTPIYAVGKLASLEYKKLTIPKDTIMHAKDATQATSPTQRKPKLVVFVVGETARADHVGQNGYSRNTFPQMSKTAGVTNFAQVTACGTSTAYSVPCMFSYVGAKDYEVDMANYNENVLETLNRLKINVLWRDNNSDSKGVMDRLPKNAYFNYKEAPTNTLCNTNEFKECRDVGMLVGLDEYVKQHQGQDVLIVLHQMGNHGPAYFKRYDKAFEQFTPVCQTNELAKCPPQHVINAYDNALLATDDFLAKTVNWLTGYDTSHQVAMLYASDHGESLGEKGVYLHGMPNAIAPVEQKHIASMFWAGQQSGIQAVASDTELSHDAITPTLLKLFDVKATVADNKVLFIK